MIIDVLAPAPVPAQLLLSLKPRPWSLWDTHLAHLVELGVAWRVLSFVWLLRREDRRERRRQPLQQRRSH